MTTRLHVVVGSLVGLGLGLAGGYLLRPAPRPCPPPPEPPPPELPAGHIFVIGEDVYVDEGFVRWLAARVSFEREGTWLVFRLPDFTIYLADLRRVPWHFYLKDQIGRRFLVRTEDGDPENDRQGGAVHDAPGSLGVIKEGGRWSSWDELMPSADEEARAEGEEGDDGEDT
ncbi:MAG: hypothetical protein R3B09_34380 [Nannocystaceae bacterium]